MLKLFEQHNAEFDKKVGHSRAKGTFQRYITVCKHLHEFIPHTYKREDIPLKELNLTFINDFEYFLRTEKKCRTNTVWGYTGLAYSDVKNLTIDNLQTFFDGNLWIITRRKKTNTESNIRLLDVPQKIIEKYKGMARDGHIFPMPSNTTCNKILKEIGRQCGFKTRLSTHVARHTNATTVLLSNGVPIEQSADCWGTPI